MSYKFKFFAQPIVTNIKTFVEVAFIEFSIGVICAFFAYTYYDGFIQVFVGCLLIALVCLFLTIHNIYVVLKIRKEQKLRDVANNS
ncbi:hypothetical protein [Paraglaciecola sp. L3A3]|uniref:hypothetical protein n=1 Tax=Paraglaciecola sp. L3A3 TaxID=2686358 RepID=UPI00131E8859|nr:hypothetical protein [Paraglaciecola sp. L3A3]